MANFDYNTLDLASHHKQLLRDSAISEEVAIARGYRSYTLEEARERRYAAKSSGLFIPRHRVDGRQDGFQLRPDDPRSSKEGKPIKYESPAGQRNILDINPLVRERLRYPKEGAFITEGARKADALASGRIPCINLAGVFGWRGKNDFEGNTALPDWEEVNLKGATWVLAFDSDILTKRPVYFALARLKALLLYRGARRVSVLLLPNKGDGKVGVDDFLGLAKKAL